MLVWDEFAIGEQCTFFNKNIEINVCFNSIFLKIFNNVEEFNLFNLIFPLFL